MRTPPASTPRRGAALLLWGGLSCQRAAPPADAPGAVMPPPVGIVALHCPTPASCRDTEGRDYLCATSQIRTGVSSGLARSCRPARCRTPPCPAVAVLSGEVVDSDRDVSRRVAARTVRARPEPGGASVATASDADGRYYFVVPVGETVLVHAEQPGCLHELHAVTMPATGWDVPLDLRHPATLGRLLGHPADVDPAQGMVVIEFIGDGALAGVGARTVPAPTASFVFDGHGGAVRGERLLAGGHRLLVLGGLTGTVRVDLLAPAGLRCAPQATGLAGWPVEPGTLTQIDAECRAATP